MLRNKKANMFAKTLPIFLIFVVGTMMILVLGFFILNWFSSNITTHSVVGFKCAFDNCKKINAGVMSIIVIFLLVFQYAFYARYRRHKHERLK